MATPPNILSIYQNGPIILRFGVLCIVMAEKKLREQLRDVARLRHLGLRTEETYWNWIKRFIFFHQKQHPRDLSSEHISQFLTHLAVDGHVAASTQNQALNALIFLYRQVLKIELPRLENVVRAPQKRRLPVVLTRDETEAIIDRLSHPQSLSCQSALRFRFTTHGSCAPAC